MTPAARLSAAIQILEQILAGDPAERTLTRWARQNRYAGSKDRASVRDIVFDCLRRKRSLFHSAGQETARGMVLAHQHHLGNNLDELCNGIRYAPEPLNQQEKDSIGNPIEVASLPVRYDFPDFLLPILERSLGDDLSSVMEAMQERAPVDLRVNRLRATRDEAERMLARDLIFTDPHELAENAMRITQNPRKLARSLAYSYGLVELQDVSSQAVASFCQAKRDMTVLDYCAGGGGKTLALAMDMHGQGHLMAHDANPNRMKDLPQRAARANAMVEILSPKVLQSKNPQCDLVVVDAPCSGTGAWRRNPDAKWRFTNADLDNLTNLQAEILKSASKYVKSGGTMIYATCSILDVENRFQVDAFLDRNKDFVFDEQLDLTPLQGGDGFYAARLLKK